MFKITDKKIECTRGDRMAFDFKIDDYTFAVGDIVEIKVYEKKALDKEPLIKKSFTITEAGESVNITLTGEETKIGEMANKAVTYWYEISLNGDRTIVGYDEDGAKEFILYPEGA